MIVKKQKNDCIYTLHQNNDYVNTKKGFYKNIIIDRKLTDCYY